MRSEIGSLQRNIPKFDTVLLHSNWSSLRRKYLSKILTDVNALSCGAKTWSISGISDAISPARHPQKSSQHVRACAAGEGAICSKNRIIVPYHGDNPNTWNGARLRSPSPIMAPATFLNSNNIYLWKYQKAWWEKRSKDYEQTLADLSSAHRRSQAKLLLFAIYQWEARWPHG